MLFLHCLKQDRESTEEASKHAQKAESAAHIKGSQLNVEGRH